MNNNMGRYSLLFLLSCVMLSGIRGDNYNSSSSTPPVSSSESPRCIDPFIRVSDKCLYFLASNMTWNEAEITCRETLSHLLTFKDLDQMISLLQHLKLKKIPQAGLEFPIWIGLYMATIRIRDQLDGFINGWFWVDNSDAIEYNAFAAKNLPEHNNLCAYLPSSTLANFKFSYNCNSTVMNAICEQPLFVD